MAVPIRLLMQDQPPLVTITPEATLQDAVARMLDHDFTQIPVVDGDGRPFGTVPSLVTSTSIARALLIFGTPLQSLRVRDAMVPARTLSADEDLFSKLDDLLNAYAVLVLNTDGTIAGIVTNYDTTRFFRRQSGDMLLVADVETTLKDHIRIAYGGDESDPEGPLQLAIDRLGSPMHSVREECRNAFRRFCRDRGVEATAQDVTDHVDRAFARSMGGKRFDKLTLADYIHLAARPEAWEVLGSAFSVPVGAFRVMLDGVRETRNKLMHFNPDVSTQERDRLRFCAEWFKNRPPVVRLKEPTAPAPVAAPPTEPDPGTAQGGAVEYVGDAPSDTTLGDEGAGTDDPYTALGEYLERLPKAQTREYLSFDRVEEIIAAPLPSAAREHRSWWANDEVMQRHAEHWLDAGWRTSFINMTHGEVVFARSQEREREYIRFFSELQGRLRGLEEFEPLAVSPSGANWLPLASYRGGACRLVVSFARGKRMRLECYIDSGDAARNNELFETLLLRREVLESAVGLPLEWEPLEGRRACRVAQYTHGDIVDAMESVDAQERLMQWSTQYAPRFHRALGTVLANPDSART